MKGDLLRDRQNGLRGLMHGARDPILERDLAVMLGEDITSIQTALRDMEMRGIVERQRLKVAFRAKPGTMNAWRLKQSQ